MRHLLFYRTSATDYLDRALEKLMSAMQSCARDVARRTQWCPSFASHVGRNYLILQKEGRVNEDLSEVWEELPR